MEIWSLLQNRRFCPTLQSAVLSQFRNRRFCPISENGDFVAFKIGCFVLPPLFCHWVLCPDTHFLVFVHFKNTSVLGLGYFQYQGSRKDTLRIPPKIQLNSVH